MQSLLPRIAERNYLLVTEEDYTKASQAASGKLENDSSGAAQKAAQIWRSKRRQ